MAENNNQNDNQEEKKLDGELIQNTDENVCYCTKCGAKNPKDAKICSSCGCLINGASSHKTSSTNNNDIVRCPNCGSSQVEFVTHQASNNFSASNACCGYLLCGPIGALFGVGPKTPAKTIRKCKNCGHEF